MYKSIRKIINLNPINKLYNTTIGDNKMGFVGVEGGNEPVVDEHYFYLEAVEADTTVKMTHYGTNQTTTKPNIMISTDKETWTEWDGTEMVLNVGERLYMYGENDSISSSSSNFSYILPSKYVNCGGNIMTLLSQDGAKTEVPTYCFYKLFGSDNAKILTAPKLPATKLGSSCYVNLFKGAHLSVAPEMPMTDLGNSCCNGMFSSYLTHINTFTETPNFVGSKLFVTCFNGMFMGCTSLEKADLSMYNGIAEGSNAGMALANMFKNCSNLREIHAPELEEWYSGMSTNWVSGVAETGVFYKKASLEIPEGTSGIPSGWTVINY